MKRGDVFMANFEPRTGSEQHGTRPCVVVMHEGFLEVSTWFSVVVVSVSTSKNQLRRSLSVIDVAGQESGLEEASVALCHQVTTLDKRKFGRKLGALTAVQLLELEAGLKFALHLS